MEPSFLDDYDYDTNINEFYLDPWDMSDDENIRVPTFEELGFFTEEELEKLQNPTEEKYDDLEQLETYMIEDVQEQNLYYKYYDPQYAMQVQFENFLKNGMNYQKYYRKYLDLIEAGPPYKRTENGEFLHDYYDNKARQTSKAVEASFKILSDSIATSKRHILYGRDVDENGVRKIYLLTTDFIKKLYGIITDPEVVKVEQGTASDINVIYDFTNGLDRFNKGVYAVIPVESVLNDDKKAMSKEGASVNAMFFKGEITKDERKKIAKNVKKDLKRINNLKQKAKKSEKVKKEKIVEKIGTLKKALDKKKEKSKKIKKEKENNGGYIKYAHKSDYKLHSLQITHIDDSLETFKKVNFDHCFVSSLIHAGDMTNEKYATFIKDLRLKLVGQFKSSAIAKLLPEWLHVQCIKYNPDMTKRGKNYVYKSSTKKPEMLVKIFLFMEHYMPDIQIEGKRASIIVRELVKNNLFELSPHHVYEKDELEDDTILTDSLVANDQKIYRYKPKPYRERDIYFGDFESIVYKESLHRGFMFGICDYNLIKKRDPETNEIIQDEKTKEPIWVLEETEPIIVEAKTEKNLNKCEILIEGLNKILEKRYSDINAVKESVEERFKKGEVTQDYKKKIDGESSKKWKKPIRIYFHNLKYDFSLILKNGLIKITKELNRKGNIYSVCFRYRGIKFELADSTKLIANKLSAFNETFKLGAIGKMDFSNYNIIDKDNYNKEYIPLKEFIIMLQERENKFFKFSDYKGYIRNGNYYHLEHYRDYLKLDCITLRAGLHKMRELIQHITNLDIFQFLTISSIGFEFAKMNKCLDETCMISGNLQRFLKKFVIGGRVGLRNNEKQYIVDKMQNFDAISLYLSSMMRMNVSKGKMVLIKGDNLITPNFKLNPEIFSKYSQYFVACRVVINKEQQIPMISVKDKTTLVREWTNNTMYETDDPLESSIVYLDKLGLEDAFKYHKIQLVEIVQAVGFPLENGYNNNINSLTSSLHIARNKAKAEKNDALSNMIKLIGNSIYGASLLCDVDTEIHYRNGVEEFINYVNNNYHRIKHIKQGDHGRYRIKCRKNIIGNENFIAFGCGVLSQSKRIMNEVMSLANDNDIPVYYNDTDSIHMRECDVNKLGDLFKKEYDRELIGNDLGQFHNDFKSDKISNDGLHSVKFIGLGKKCYLHILENSKGEQDYYARFKGANIENLLSYCKKKDMNLEQLYESFYRDEEHAINIADGKVRFKFTENGVRTVDNMLKYFSFDSREKRALRQVERNKNKK